ncbi:transposase [Arthrobacter sp. H41]|uniref:transposase n=1 Tax=Arthrobacter sp. H41 TaxID=1312978 RepID=UPI0009DE856E|nr:transposase [Arthrobacter sp. H41]
MATCVRSANPPGSCHGTELDAVVLDTGAGITVVDTALDIRYPQLFDEVVRPTGTDAVGQTLWPPQPDGRLNGFSWTPRSTERTSTQRTSSWRRDLSSYMKLQDGRPDHAIGRSRGGLTTKIHHLCDGKIRPLVMVLGPRQGGDFPMFPHRLDALSVPRLGPGRARFRPDRALGDKAYSSNASRELLRARGVQAVISERSDEEASRKRRGKQASVVHKYDFERELLIRMRIR